MAYRSRLQNRVRKNTALSIVLLIVVLLVVMFFGIQLLVKFSLLLGRIKSINETPSTSQSSEFVLPPSLNPLFEATNSATVDISGVGAQSGETVELFINDQKRDDTIVDNNSQFTFSRIHLEQGDNQIKVKAKQDGKESAFSSPVSITYETTPPALEVKEPTDGQTTKTKQVRIVGKTDPDGSISINDFLPIVDSNGNFSYNLPLMEGENTIKIVARDKAGNQTTNEIKVTYSP